MLSTVYSNPSVDSLTSAIMQLSSQTWASETSSEQERLRGRKALLEEYKERIDRIRFHPKARVKSDHKAVILTGSTGVPSSYFLDKLLSSKKFSCGSCDLPEQSVRFFVFSIYDKRSSRTF